MLKSIGDARLQSPFILFVGHSTEPLGTRTYVCDPLHPLPDGADRNGASLFLSILKSYIKSAERVTHVLCWERKTVKHLQDLEEQDRLKLRIHDCLADFHGWINPDNKETGLISLIKKSVSADTKEINVIVDSLSNPLFTLGFAHCLQEIQQMINSPIDNGPRIQQLMCLVHSDVLPCGPSSLSHLKHLASTVVELKNQVARITHRKPGGHVERKEEKYSLSAGHICIQPFRIPAHTELAHAEDRVKATPLPQDVASFRVALSDKEKEEKDKLVLPYMRTSEKPEEGGGKVFYQPDAVDDWDDEDPDDDLDV